MICCFFSSPDRFFILLSPFFFTPLTTPIRNILIDNLKPLSERIDQGALWENFLIAERIKRNHYLGISARPYFWRVYTGSEIDYVEDGTDGLHAFELKYRKAKVRPPKTWVQEYPEASWKAVNMQD